MAEPITEAAADVKAADAASKTGVVQSGAAVGASGAGTTTGIGQTDVSGAQRSATVQAESVTDIGQGEDAIKELAVASKLWGLNAKRLAAGELSQDADLRAIQTGLYTRAVHNAETFDQNIRATFLQITNNMVALANAQNVSSHDINNRSKINAGSHDQRVQVIAEEGISENPIFQDAVSAAVVKKLAELGVVVPKA